MTDCTHAQGEHFLGDCGDMLDYIAIPTHTATQVGQTVLNTLTDTLGLPPAPCPPLPAVVMSMR